MNQHAKLRSKNVKNDESDELLKNQSDSREITSLITNFSGIRDEIVASILMSCFGFILFLLDRGHHVHFSPIMTLNSIDILFILIFFILIFMTFFRINLDRNRLLDKIKKELNEYSHLNEMELYTKEIRNMPFEDLEGIIREGFSKFKKQEYENIKNDFYDNLRKELIVNLKVGNFHEAFSVIFKPDSLEVDKIKDEILSDVKHYIIENIENTPDVINGIAQCARTKSKNLNIWVIFLRIRLILCAMNCVLPFIFYLKGDFFGNRSPWLLLYQLFLLIILLFRPSWISDAYEWFKRHKIYKLLTSNRFFKWIISIKKSKKGNSVKDDNRQNPAQTRIIFENSLDIRKIVCVSGALVFLLFLQALIINRCIYNKFEFKNKELGVLIANFEDHTQVFGEAAHTRLNIQKHLDFTIKTFVEQSKFFNHDLMKFVGNDFMLNNRSTDNSQDALYVNVQRYRNTINSTEQAQKVLLQTKADLLIWGGGILLAENMEGLEKGSSRKIFINQEMRVKNLLEPFIKKLVTKLDSTRYFERNGKERIEIFQILSKPECFSKLGEIVTMVNDVRWPLLYLRSLHYANDDNLYMALHCLLSGFENLSLPSNDAVYAEYISLLNNAISEIIQVFYYAARQEAGNQNEVNALKREYIEKSQEIHNLRKEKLVHDEMNDKAIIEDVNAILRTDVLWKEKDEGDQVYGQIINNYANIETQLSLHPSLISNAQRAKLYSILAEAYIKENNNYQLANNLLNEAIRLAVNDQTKDKYIVQQAEYLIKDRESEKALTMVSDLISRREKALLDTLISKKLINSRNKDILDLSDKIKFRDYRSDFAFLSHAYGVFIKARIELAKSIDLANQRLAPLMAIKPDVKYIKLFDTNNLMYNQCLGHIYKEMGESLPDSTEKKGAYLNEIEQYIEIAVGLKYYTDYERINLKSALLLASTNAKKYGAAASEIKLRFENQIILQTAEFKKIFFNNILKELNFV